MEVKIKSIIREIELSRVLDHPLEGDALVIQTFFDDLFNGLEISTLDKYPYSIFFVKNGHEVYMEQDYKNERLYCSYNKIWSFFKSKLNLNGQEISNLIKYMVEQQFKNKVFTPEFDFIWSSPPVEQQLKNKVFTPYDRLFTEPSPVEQQLKNKVFTPVDDSFSALFGVEQQLKNKVFTPLSLLDHHQIGVEQQLKKRVSVS